MEPAPPPDLQKAIAEAYAALINDPQHALLPMYRHRIYEALGAVHYPEEPLDPRAQLTRVVLDLLSVRRVLPIWEAERPDFPWPQRLLELAEGVLDGLVSREVARAEADAAFALLDEVDYEASAHDITEVEASRDVIRFRRVSLPAYYVCDAAVETLFVASGLFRFELGEPVPDETDADVDPYTSDTAHWASTAYAGGVWDPSSDPIKRNEFWEWWLSEAVPKVRQASQE
jgi:hypothetical protein